MRQKIYFLLIAAASLMLGSCEKLVVMNSKVHEDGSIDKSIMMGELDSTSERVNYFGINEASGWDFSSQPSKKDDGTIMPEKFDMTFKKSFESAEAINGDLDRDTDSLFRVHTTFEKSFRWFYTYIRYSETVRPIDRLHSVNAKDFFAKEDYDFIDRLPGEGIAISKADSIYLQLLNEKIFEQYAEHGLFEEHYKILREVVGKNTNDPKWLDTLSKKRSYIYKRLDKDDIGDVRAAIHVLDTLGFPIDKQKATNDFYELSKDFNSRYQFMGYAQNIKLINSVEMPWTVIRSNADSIAGNTLYWKPLVTKFALTEFTMTAESRQFNWWAAGLTAVLIGGTIFLFVRKKPD